MVRQQTYNAVYVDHWNKLFVCCLPSVWYASWFPRTKYSLCQLHRSVSHDRCKLIWTCERFPICDDKITENDQCVIKIIGIHWKYTEGANLRKNLNFLPPVLIIKSMNWNILTVSLALNERRGGSIVGT